MTICPRAGTTVLSSTPPSFEAISPVQLTTRSAASPPLKKETEAEAEAEIEEEMEEEALMVVVVVVS